MNSKVLWRRLTETDFNAMYGRASPYGRGGGAMHIALGVRSSDFPIDRFLNAGARKTVTIEAGSQVEGRERAALTFSSNPERRHGEWLIRDQFSNRHPAWSPASGFPKKYDVNTPTYVLVFRVGRTFHARFADRKLLVRMGSNALPKEMLSQPKGIGTASTTLLRALGVPPETLLESFNEAITTDQGEPFDPSDVSDGRRRVIAAVIRRLGQGLFRRRLFAAYGGRCALTRCTTEWVLEAAHITPYRGARTNTLSNGLLLRADIHTLFDLALISIEPSYIRIRVSSRLARSPYAELNGTKPAFPSLPAARPSPAALSEHYKLFHP